VGCLAFLATAVGLASPGIRAAWAPATPPPASVHRPAVPGSTLPAVLDRHVLVEFFDTLIPAQLEERHIPGAVVAVVQEGELVFAQGYGWADLDHQIPVAPNRTLFHIGSNAKLFTWTAVMQQVKQGRLASTPTSTPISTS
jgi:CubicO group peptidase (beta-lactamase class C family)